MNLFRVDTRFFKVGELIQPKNCFEKILKDERAEIEDWLNKLHPSEMPERGKCLFLFQDLSCALHHVAKYGGYIYCVSPGFVYFRGDMNKLDNILYVFKITKDDGIREAVIKEYWNAFSSTYNPCYEILANQAVVESFICGEDIKSRITEELKSKGGCIERCPIYLDLLKKIYT